MKYEIKKMALDLGAKANASVEMLPGCIAGCTPFHHTVLAGSALDFPGDDVHHILVVFAGEAEFATDGKALFSGKSIGVKRIRVLESPLSAKNCEVRVLKHGGNLKGVSYKLYLVDPALVKTVLAATTESGETDTAKWMTAP